jgi:hypothetical protein
MGEVDWLVVFPLRLKLLPPWPKIYLRLCQVGMVAVIWKQILVPMLIHSVRFQKSFCPGHFTEMKG